MPQRDYAKRKNQSSGKLVIISFALLILFGFIGTLFYLKQNAPTPIQPENTVPPPKTETTAQLPSKPQENWSFVRNLEMREIPVDKALTEEQRQALKALEQDKRLQEEKRLVAEKAAMEQQAKPEETQAKPVLQETSTKTNQVSEEEQKRQVVLQKTQLETKEKAEEVKQAQQKNEAQLKAEKAKAEQLKAEAKKKVEAKKQVQAITQEATVKSVAKFGLQCGAFKNRAQAENMQARLAMAGYNARINSNAEWNRVVVGPLGDRNAAIAAQSNAKSVADCVVVGM